MWITAEKVDKSVKKRFSHQEVGKSSEKRGFYISFPKKMFTLHYAILCTTMDLSGASLHYTMYMSYILQHYFLIVFYLQRFFPFLLSSLPAFFQVLFSSLYLYIVVLKIFCAFFDLSSCTYLHLGLISRCQPLKPLNVLTTVRGRQPPKKSARRTFGRRTPLRNKLRLSD